MIISLCGFMASGKSRVARALQQTLQEGAIYHIDTDTYIEQKEGCTINALFAEGEEYFRTKEREALSEIIESHSGERTLILSLGGGTPLENTTLIKEKTHCIYLHCEVAELARRLMESPQTRPLLTKVLEDAGQKVKEETIVGWVAKTIDVREPIYRECSIAEVDTTIWDLTAIVDEISTILKRFTT